MLENIIDRCKYVVQNAGYVKINYEKIEDFVKKINHFECRHYLTENSFEIMELNTEDIVNFLLIYEAIDFSFWGSPKWTINAEGENLDGAVALLYSMQKLFKNKDQNWFIYLSKMPQEDLKKFLQGNIEIPLFNERYNIVTSIAKKVVAEMDSDFYSRVANIGTDTELSNFIVGNFSRFKDERNYNGKVIPFYKLAQLLTSDILHVLEFKENRKVDYSHLVGCADYKIPQVMRAYGILEYNDKLASIVDNKIVISENSKFEVEIRASMIVVIDYIYDKLGRTIKRSDINDYIWGKGREKGLELKPYHLTRTMSY